MLKGPQEETETMEGVEENYQRNDKLFILTR